MAGIWIRSGTIAVTNGSKKITGSGTSWASALIKPKKGSMLLIDGEPYEVDYVNSNTELYVVESFTGSTASGKAYKIQSFASDTIPDLSSRIAAVLAYMATQYGNLQTWMSGSGNVTLTMPDGQSVTIPAASELQETIDAGNASEIMQILGAVSKSANNAVTGKLALTQNGNGYLLRTGYPDVDTSGISWGSTSVPHVSINSVTNGAALTIARYSADPIGAAINLGKSRSTTIPSRGATLSGDTLGGIYFSGCRTSDPGTDGLGASGYFFYRASQDWSATAMGGYFTWHTTPDDSAARTEAMRLTGANELLVNTSYARSPNGGEKLSVYGNSYASGYVESGSELRVSRETSSSIPSVIVANRYWGDTNLPASTVTAGNIVFKGKSATSDAYAGRYLADLYAQMQPDGSGTLTVRSQDATGAVKTYLRLMGNTPKMFVNTGTDDGLGSVLQVNGTVGAVSPVAGDSSRLLATTEWVNGLFESGSFTVVASGSSTAGVGTYTSQSGKYKKISDKLAQVDIYIGWSAHTGVGNLMISGLPFAAKTTSIGSVLISGATFNSAPTAYISSNSTTINVRQNVSGGSHAGVQIPSGATSIWLSFTYEIS